MNAPTTQQQERNAQLYLRAHRNVHGLNLGAEHQAANQQILDQLDHQDPDARERALVGTSRHTGRLSPSDRAYQRHWQQAEGLSEADVQHRRHQLNHPATPPGRPAAKTPGRPRPGVPLSRALRNPGRTIRSSGGTAGAGASGAASLWWDLITSGVVLSMVYLILTRGQVLGSILNGVTGGFARLANPTDSLLGAAPAAARPAPPYGGLTGMQLLNRQANRTAAALPKAAANAVLSTPAGAIGVHPPGVQVGLPSYATLTPTIP